MWGRGFSVGSEIFLGEIRIRGHDGKNFVKSQPKDRSFKDHAALVLKIEIKILNNDHS